MKKILFVLLVLCIAVGAFMNRNVIREKVAQYIEENVIEIISNEKELEQIPAEILEAHIKMRPDSVVSVTKGWIPYFYRHEREREISDVLLLIVKEGKFNKEYKYFFASLLSKYPHHRKVLSAIQPSLKRNESEIIEQVLQDSYNYQPANYTSPVEHEKIWAEYAITGDDTIVKNYISLVTSTDEAITRIGKEKIIDYLYRKSKVYVKVYRAIKAIVEFSPADNVELQKISSKLYDYIYKPAWHYYTIAKNHRKNKLYDKALTAIRAGLFFAPDESYLYREMGYIYLSQKKYNEALLYYQQVRWTIHSYNLGHVYLKIGRIYNHLGKKDLAHLAFKKAYRLKPGDDTILSNLAYSYSQRGDIDGAVLYLKEMLKQKPDPENIAYAKHFFKEHSIDYVIENESLQTLLSEHKFQKLDDILKKTYKEKTQNVDGIYGIHSKIDELSSISWAGRATFEKFSEYHLEWVKQDPGSYFANASFGDFYVTYAWHARGNGYASTITPEARKLFHKRLRLAEKYLTRAYEIDPTYSIAPCKMITVAKVHPDLSDEDVEKWFKRAIQANPADPEPYSLKVNYLAPKWGGSIEKRFAFARDTFKNAPVDSMAPKILAQVHWSIYDTTKDVNYFKQKRVWTELKAVYTELVKRYPDSMNRHNWFAKTACLAEDFETARAEFKIIGDRWEQSVWNTHESFDFHKNAAFQKGE